MPRVEIKEKTSKRIVKAPFRATGAILLGTGHAIKAVGHGIGRVGHVLKMGPSSEWVAEVDVGPDGKKKDYSKKIVKPEQPAKKTMTVFTEKGGKTWDDGASVASTDVSSTYDEKHDKEFV